MATAPIDTNQILATIKLEYLRPLIAVMGRAATTAASGVHDAINDAAGAPPNMGNNTGAAPGGAGNGPILAAPGAQVGVANTYVQNWDATRFKQLATLNRDPLAGAAGSPAALGVARVAGVVPGGAAPAAGAPGSNNTDYAVADYAAVFEAGTGSAPGALAGVAPGAPLPVALLLANGAKNMAKAAVLIDLGIPVNANGTPNNSRLGDLISDIFDQDYVLNEKTNRLIFNVPKSDEIMRRLVASIYAKKMGLPLNAGLGGNARHISANVAAEIRNQARKKLYNTMPKSESDAYLALITLTPEEKDSLDRFDRHIDEIRAALSEGATPSVSPILASNIILGVAKSNIARISSSPHRDVILNRRRSDPSNPGNAAAAMNRINIAVNNGSGMRGGASKNKAGPLYPKIVMHGGSHPFAVLEGGAAVAIPNIPTRDTPNTVALLDARIRELHAQFKSATGKDLDRTLSTNIVGYSGTIYDTIKQVQTGLNTLADANKALAQYPVGLGIDAGTFTEAQLKNITTQADEINKNALKASKQITKLEQIADTLEELVKKSSPARRV